MKKSLGMIAVLGWALLIAGCGNGGAHLNSGGGSGPTPVQSAVQLGSGGSSFQAGVLEITNSQLSAGGSTTVSAALQYTDGTPYTSSATITFTSSCYQSGLASFTVNGTVGNTVTTTTGQANITYVATGCNGSDTITATTSVNGDTLTATGVVTVAPAAVGFIQFVSSTPGIISLKGTGGSQTSTVIFKVTDASGGPVPGAKVNFSLNTTVGGITFAPSSATTGNNGEVQTVVQAGTQHTTVRVTATAHTGGGNVISTQSPGIVISTGIPTEKHFSLSVASHNVEGYDVDGTTDKVQVILSDRFGNPVPDGTQIAFFTTGGQIQPSCKTENGTGSCTVTWTSASPRPPAPPSSAPVPGTLSIIGHAEILAYATGEESFIDVNGNGIFDRGDRFTPDKTAPATADNFFGAPPPQDDIGEIYLDQAQLGHYVKGDFFFDFNHDGVRNPPNGKFYGYGFGLPDCEPSNDPPAPCGGSTFGVGVQTCIVMSTSQVTIVGPKNAAPLSPGDTRNYEVYDENHNVPPSGMTFSVSASGPTVSVLQRAVPSISGCPKPPASYTITVNVSSTSRPGTFYLVATSPVTSTISYSNAITVK